MSTAKLNKCGVCHALVQPFATRCDKHADWKAWKFVFRSKGRVGGLLNVTKYGTTVARVREKAEEEARSILGKDFAPAIRVEECWGV